MRSTGILRSWNDERGFGFIAPTQGGAELFVHVSALPRDGSRPVVGETLSFELGRGRDGRVQAVKVVRTAVGTDLRPATPAARQVHRPRWHDSSPLPLGRGLVVVLIVASGAAGYRWFQADRHRRDLERQPPAIAAPEPATLPAPARISLPDVPPPGYRCDGRTQCSQMTSCAEATWFINHCPGTAMDGDHDGVPCELQWCTSPSAR